MNDDIMMLEAETSTRSKDGVLWWDSKQSMKEWPQLPIKKWFGDARTLYLYMGVSSEEMHVVSAFDRRDVSGHLSSLIINPYTMQLVATGTPKKIWDELMAHARMMTACADREVV